MQTGKALSFRAASIHDANALLKRKAIIAAHRAKTRALGLATIARVKTTPATGSAIW
jgi:hypothetical protein